MPAGDDEKCLTALCINLGAGDQALPTEERVRGVERFLQATAAEWIPDLVFTQVLCQS